MAENAHVLQAETYIREAYDFIAIATTEIGRAISDFSGRHDSASVAVLRGAQCSLDTSSQALLFALSQT